jgi:glyoxylase-like metal-dependent hydrolase (beta-lactamase superfamily II)
MQVTASVYAFDATRGSYAYLVLDSEKLIIDTGRPGQGSGILNELHALHIQPGEVRRILLTHHDVDHIGNAALLEQASGAGVWAPRADIPYITRQTPRPGIKKVISTLMKVTPPHDLRPYPDDGRLPALR